MNYEDEKFLDLLELYPETAKNLKLRALEKRSIFIYYKNKVENRRAKKLGQVSPKDSEQNGNLLYKSTYTGRENDSDKDEFHITMPFAHNEEIHH